MTLATVTLDDKYTLDTGRIYLTGIQALVRLPLLQRRRDLAAGLNTAGFISGYRGSPLGGLDQQLWHAQQPAGAAPHPLPARPQRGPRRHRGLGQPAGQPVPRRASTTASSRMWYGKGPGVDRTGDVFKHANFAGTARHGGVLVVAGDDHAAKSSTLPHQSEYAFMDASMPVLNPAGVQEMLDLGLYGWAMSRYSRLLGGRSRRSPRRWTIAASVDVDPQRVAIALPEDFAHAAGRPQHPLAGSQPLEQERRLQALQAAGGARLRPRQPARPGRCWTARARGSASSPPARPISTCARRWPISASTTRSPRRSGIRLYKVGMTWPLEPTGVRALRRAASRRSWWSRRSARCSSASSRTSSTTCQRTRPRIVGKEDEHGAPLLAVSRRARCRCRWRAAIAARIARFAPPATRASPTASPYLDARERQPRTAKAPLERTPYFCSGCPHNTLDHVPEGAAPLAGIGCHYMAIWMDRDTATYHARWAARA